MSALAAAFAQLLHCALILAVAPLIMGLKAAAEARISGRDGASPWQPWRDLIRLSRKQAATTESASAVSRTAPLAGLAAATVAAFLVPSFTLGMAFAPLADLLVLFGLLAASRMALALAALDPGTPVAGLAAARAAALGCLSEPAVFLVVLTLGLLGGTTNLDLLIGLQLQGMLQPIAASALVAVALVLLALAVPDASLLTTEFSGGDLALVELAEALRLVVWLDLIGGLFLPLGMAEPDAGPLGWVIGLVSWAVRIIVLTTLLASLRVGLGHARPRLAPRTIGVAAALGLLAALLVLATAVAA